MESLTKSVPSSWGTHHMTPALTLKTLAHFQKRNRTSVSVPTNFPDVKTPFSFFLIFLLFFAAVHMGKVETLWGGGGRVNCHFSFLLPHWKIYHRIKENERFILRMLRRCIGKK